MNLKVNPGFEVEGNVTELHQQKSIDTASFQILQVALTALSQRALVALASLFSILLAASVFALFWAVLPNPSQQSLIGLGMYAAFVLVLHLVRARR